MFIKQLAIAALLVASSVDAADFRLKAASSDRLGKMSLLHDGDSFYVENGSSRKRIQPAYMSRELRTVKAHQLAALQKNGYLRVNKMEDGEYSLSAHAKGNGGGPITGWLFYTATKATCYGAILGTAGAAATAVGAPALVGAAAQGGIAAAAGMLGTSTAAGAVAAAAGTAIVETGGAAAALAVTHTAIAAGASSGFAAAMVATTIAVESVSAAAGAAGTALWFLP